MALSDSPNPIAAYAKAQSPELGAICDKLQAEIDRAIPNATSKIWHGGPVSFVGENPVVGYDVRKDRVDLLFWSGQLFEESLLKPMGKDKAARAIFENASEINLPDVRRWLKKSRTIIFDYVGMYAQKRETSNIETPEARLTF
jgi:Domain of unknown function (DU1801)